MRETYCFLGSPITITVSKFEVMIFFKRTFERFPVSYYRCQEPRWREVLESPPSVGGKYKALSERGFSSSACSFTTTFRKLSGARAVPPFGNGQGTETLKYDSKTQCFLCNHFAKMNAIRSQTKHGPAYI